MNRICKIFSGEDYARKHLNYNDYVDENGKVQGTWHGKGAEALGLRGRVEDKDFAALMRGENPRTGESVRLQEGGSKHDSDGNQTARRVAAYDSVMSAPKDVSVLAMEDERVRPAYDRAMMRTIDEIEQRMAIRDMKGGMKENRHAMPVIARYPHSSSRDLDPQLHDHLIFFNVGIDPKTGQTRVLDGWQLFKCRALFTEIFRAEMAREMVALGYVLETHHDKDDKEIAWKAKGISNEVRDKFSERSAERDAGKAAELERRQEVLKTFPGGDAAKLDAWLAAKGELWYDRSAKTLSDAEVSQIVRETRAPKLRHISTEDVLAYQQAKMTASEREQLANVVAEAKRLANPDVLTWGTTETENGRPVPARGAVEWGILHVMERKSVASADEVLRETMKHFRGLDFRAAMESLDALSAEGKILYGATPGTLDYALTTSEQVATEMRMLALVKDGIGGHGRISDADVFPPLTGRESASENDQRRAVGKLLESRDFTSCFTGAAGSGKTFCSRKIAEAIRAKGQKVWAMAPTASAVEELKNSGFENAQTIAMTLLKQGDVSFGPQEGDFILVDEAGLVGSRDMLAILDYANRRGARVILQGDANHQIRSVSSGDAMATIEAETICARASLTEIRRQSSKQYRDAVKALRTNPDDGFAKLDAMGAVQQCESDTLGDEVARAYFEEADKVSKGGKTQTVGIVAATHADIDKATKSIRAERIRRGEIDSTNQVQRTCLQSTQWTEAQKTRAGGYEESFVVRFQKPYGDRYSRNDKSEVVGVNPETGKIRLRNPDDGAIIEMSGAAISKHCDVLRKKELPVAAGDKIMFTVNCRVDRKGDSRKKCVNGEVATVQSVDTETGEIVLKDGRILGRDFDDFCLAYAQTAYKAQSRTLDAVIVMGDGLNKQAFYVAVTRGRKTVKIFTRDKEALANNIGVSGARRSATAFARDYVEAATLRKDNERQEAVGVSQPVPAKAMPEPVAAKPVPPPIPELQGRGPIIAPTRNKSINGR